MQTRAQEAEEDRVLILQAQQGDVGAFRQLVERHQRRAFAIAFGIVRDENDARELVQDAFLRVHKNLHTFQGSSSFFTWLYRIISNLGIDLKRRPGRKVKSVALDQFSEDDVSETDSPILNRLDRAEPFDTVRRREIATRLQQALDELSDHHRAVIVMRELEGLSYEDMAVALGVSKGTVMSRLFHARQRLQKALADCYAEQGGKIETTSPDNRNRDDAGDSEEVPS